MTGSRSGISLPRYLLLGYETRPVPPPCFIFPVMVALEKRHVHTGRIDVDTGVSLEQYTVSTFFHVDPLATLCYRKDKRNEILRYNLADYRIASVKLEISVTGID
jgi:hypothetical protein